MLALLHDTSPEFHVVCGMKCNLCFQATGWKFFQCALTVTCLGIRPILDTTGYEKAVHWQWS